MMIVAMPSTRVAAVPVPRRRSVDPVSGSSSSVVVVVMVGSVSCRFAWAAFNLVSSISGPNARAPPTPNATANTASRPIHGQPSESATPPVPSADSTARVAPIRTGATTGSTSSGSRVSRPEKPAVRPPYSVPTQASPQVATNESCDEQARHRRAGRPRRTAGSPRRSGRLRGRRAATASASDFAPEDGDRVDAGHSQRVERAVVGLDRERTLDQQQQAEQGREPDEPGRDDQPLERRFGDASSANANMTIVTPANGITWLVSDAAAPLDPQVLRRRRGGRSSSGSANVMRRPR